MHSSHAESRARSGYNPADGSAVPLLHSEKGDKGGGGEGADEYSSKESTRTKQIQRSSQLKQTLAVGQWWFFNVLTVILNKYIFQGKYLCMLNVVCVSI